ncbi:hypothetical protein ROLI_001250 [Roseobacter fucihabitans]|uniref:Uncharacterized protein n=1 Tax=Roseobacter fucihabitans TaxID=1537242 RepID=A0ABZ2BM59_9RHOB|nr:hypothetical protein [Roseobacter litoralis]MBC6963376.1 hypothetical protein [Roseobacter litoralis]
MAWQYWQCGFVLNRKDRHITPGRTVTRRKHAKSPVQEEAVLIEDVLKMASILSFGPHHMQDRGILLIGYAGDPRCSEIVCFDLSKDATEDGYCWIESLTDDAVLNLYGKTGLARSRQAKCAKLPRPRFGRHASLCCTVAQP